MTTRLKTSIKSCFRPRLRKRKRLEAATITPVIEPQLKGQGEIMASSKGEQGADRQSQSPFLRNLPIEIRQAVYDHVWASQGYEYHIYQKDGHLYHARCVMNSLDERFDFIQNEMDRMYEAPVMEKLRDASLRMWYRRLAGDSWGRRHWRCEERLDFASCRNGDLSRLDDTNWMSMLLICKQM